MKITREAFLYLDGDNARFAQCDSCAFVADAHCAIMGWKEVSSAKGSCNFYIAGEPTRRWVANLTKAQVGYVERKVRCENCLFYGAGHCGLYRTLNREQPALFDLDEKVARHGCCNAQAPP